MKKEDKKHPRIGVGVIIRHEGKCLLLKRRGSHGEGDWAFIGGHLEHGETVEECAEREVLEEVGVKLKTKALSIFTQDVFENEGKHYITLFVVADLKPGQDIRICEPEKCEKLEWHSWNRLPQPLFLPVENLIKTGFDPFHE